MSAKPLATGRGSGRPKSGTDATWPEKPAPGDTLDGPASPLRPPHRSLYLDFSIGDGGQILGIAGDGDGPDAVTFGAAVEYRVHRDPARQDRGQAFAGRTLVPRGPTPKT